MSIDVSKLHVITMISNPVRYSSRYKLYEEFARHMRDSGVNFWTAEVTFGKRDPHILDPRLIDGRHLNSNIIHLQTDHELWHKENALNLLVEHLPKDWEYVAWVDADIQFPVWQGPKAWYIETVQALQHHRIVQLFQNAIDIGPDGEALGTHSGFAYGHVNDLQYEKPYRGNHMHPGYAWAMRRKTWDDTGGLIDYAILGAADNHMAHAWIGKIDFGVHPKMSGAYLAKLRAYQARCEHFVKRDIGYVKGTVIHGWHGKKKDRKYHDRWQILLKNQYDPDMDLKKDWQGLLQLTDLGDTRSNTLRDEIRRYMRQRNEDSIDVE